MCGRSTDQSNKNETIVNHFSESSSKAYIECSFTNFEKKRKSRQKETQSSNFTNLNNKSLITFNENLRSSSVTSAQSRSKQAFASPVSVTAESQFPEQRAFLFATTVKEKENPFELRMFSSEANIYGKAINQIIRTNSYRSNIC